MLNIAILGTGAIADSHIRAYLKYPDLCRIVALADLYPDKARAKASQYQLSVPVFASVADLLHGPTFDAASVCLPPFEHASASITLLRAGRHVLVEKPLATCLEECDAMLDAERAGGALLSVVAQNRYQTPIWRLKRVLDSGLIGPVRHAQVNSLWWRGQNYYDLWWRGTWAKEGGGCTINHAVHHIDLFQWFMGMPTEVQAFTTNLAHDNSEVEDFATAILLFPNSCIGQITASLVHHGEEQSISFQGRDAQISAPWQVKAMLQKENGFPEANPPLVRQIQQCFEQVPPLAAEGHDGQIANFLAAVMGREPLLVDGHQGRRTIELITAIYRSDHTRQPVRLPLTAADPFYARQGILRTVRHFHEKTKTIVNFSQNEITLGRNLSR
jgi:UDP-N-acetyl-2-amino-2-deoxyglucuronate dehydrogenase